MIRGQRVKHLRGGNGSFNPNRQALPRVLVQDRRYPQLAAFLRTVFPEVVRPHVGDPFRLVDDFPLQSPASFPPRPAGDLYPLSRPNPMHPFAVHG